jgi:methionine-gamma-lyase
MISTSAVYGPSRGLMETILHGMGVESTYIDTANLELVEKNIRPNTKLIYLETPANPTIRLTDIEAVSTIAHKHNIPVCVDNTFSSPYLQQPLNLGADIVLHSLTKFINGHADIVGGAVVCKNDDHLKKIRKTMTLLGNNMDPHQAYLVIRGVKTLSLRVERATQNAKKVAEFLENHPKVEWVKYPGLKSFDQYELAQRQMKDSGAMISFELKGGYNAGVVLMNNVHLALLAVSLGGVESLIQHPASMTHSSVPKEEKLAANITDGLVRFSVGIENVEDIISDLSQALDKI